MYKVLASIYRCQGCKRLLFVHDVDSPPKIQKVCLHCGMVGCSGCILGDKCPHCGKKMAIYEVEIPGGHVTYYWDDERPHYRAGQKDVTDQISKVV